MKKEYDLYELSHNYKYHQDNSPFKIGYFLISKEDNTAIVSHLYPYHIRNYFRKTKQQKNAYRMMDDNIGYLLIDRLNMFFNNESKNILDCNKDTIVNNIFNNSNYCKPLNSFFRLLKNNDMNFNLISSLQFDINEFESHQFNLNSLKYKIIFDYLISLTKDNILEQFFTNVSQRVRPKFNMGFTNENFYNYIEYSENRYLGDVKMFVKFNN